MGAIISIPATRYVRASSFSTALDPLQDLLLHLEFLTARDSAAEFLRNRCVADPQADLRASVVANHARVARAFVEQALAGSELTAFVPCYYAVLNLAKLIILFSDEHDQLAEHRYHGLSYDPLQNPPSLLDDVVTLHPKGVVPLLYRALTGKAPTQASLKISTGEVYRLIPGCSYEWSVATGGAAYLAQLSFRSDALPDGTALRVSVSSDFEDPPRLHELDALRAVTPVAGSPGTFESEARFPADASTGAMIDAVLVRDRLYHPDADSTQVAVGRLAGIPVVEELPLIVALYHLSSVARYNPDFIEVLRASRYWPVAAALRTHALYKAILLTWSHIRGETVLPELR